VSRHKIIVGTEIVLILGLVGFVAAMVGIEHVAPGAAGLGPLTALAFAAIPSALWLGYFYLQDRNEPEPKQLVGGVFLIGAFIAAPLAGFANDLIAVAGADLDPLSVNRLLSNILLVGVVQETAKYVVVRYSVYHHREFDEPMDGIIYMMAAGIGFATAQNYHRLAGLGGNVVLSQAAMNAVITTLAHACFAGVLGYALGSAKFTKASPVTRGVHLLAGLVAAAVLNGVFASLEDRVTLAGVNSGAAWRGLAWAAGFSAVVFFAVSTLMKRQLAASPFPPEAAGSTTGGAS
jgi:RsiW-degrading membrane proteinase PrsW (M82 family)